MLKNARIARIFFVIVAAAALLLALESLRERNIVQATHEELDRTLENVVGRIRFADANLNISRSVLDASALAKARAWAMLVELDASVPNDVRRMREFCAKLNVQGVYLLDDRGALVAAEPKVPSEGAALSAELFASFQACVTNRAAEKILEPRPEKGVEGFVQYVGVARRDRPGVAVIAVHRRSTLAMREGLSDDHIARTSRIRSGGFVRIERADGVRACAQDGDDADFLRSSVYAGRRIVVGMPPPQAFLSDDWTCLSLVILAAFLHLLLLLSIVKNVHRMSRADARGVVILLFASLSLVLAFESFREASGLESCRQRILLGLESVTARLRASDENEMTLETLTKQSDLEMSRAFALIAAADPKIAADKARAARIRADLLADDVAATDERGSRAARLNRYRSLVDTEMVAAGGLGDVFVEVAEVKTGETSCRKGYFAETRNGMQCLCLSSICGERVVTVSSPTPLSLLAGPVVSKAVVILAIVFFLLLQWTLVPEVVLAFWNYLKQFFGFFWGLRAEKSELPVAETRRTFAQLLASPIVLATLVIYVLMLGSIYLLCQPAEEAKVRVKLCDDARTALAGLSNSIDNMLFAIGRAMVRHYRSPDGVTCDMAEELARRYDVDEMSFVDSNGVARVSSFGDIDWPMTNGVESGKFNCLLHGVQNYAQPFRGAAEDPNVVRKYAGVPFPDVPGYVQIGIDRKRLTGDLRYLFEEHVQARRMSNGGFIIWANGETGEIIANGAPQAQAGETLAGVGFNSVVAPEPGVPFDAEFYGERCIVTWMPLAHLRLYAVQPYSGVTVWNLVRLSGAILFVVFAIFAVLSLRLSSLMTRFSGLAARLKEMMLADQERQSKDLTLAKTIQSSALPLSFPVERDFGIYATMKTAREVGGDFYDFYTRQDGKILFVVADVSGKGVPAAMFMMRAKAILRAAVFESPHSISTAVRYANENLAENNEAEMFVTAWIGVYDRTKGEIAYVNAGHNPPLIRRADGSVEWLRSKNGLPLAAVGGILYSSSRVTLNPGDSLFLYTDGVTEAANTDLEMYGEARLEKILAQSAGNCAQAVAADIAAFTAGAEQSDDLTMLVFDRLAFNA